MSPTAKLMGIIVPVLLANTFCLTAPFIILIADAAVLTAAIVFFLMERRESGTVRVVDERDEPGCP